MPGTDFVRSVPRIGPHRVWELLPLVLRKMDKINLFKQDSILLDEDIVCDVVIKRLYAEVFSAHAPKKLPNTFHELSTELKSPLCKLAPATRDSFPSMETLATTVRNVSWNLCYWVHASTCDMAGCPDPIQPTYGYALDDRGKPQYLDLVISPDTQSHPKNKRAKTP